MSKKNLFLATCYIHTTETILLETYSSLGYLIWISENFSRKKRKQCLQLKKANLYSTAISSITAIFSCVQDNKQIKVIQRNLNIMNLDIMNLYITKSSV